MFLHRDGKTGALENVYIRGSKIRFLILPDMLKNAPMFKKVQGRGGGAGRGKSAILRAQGNFSGYYFNGTRLSVPFGHMHPITIYGCPRLRIKCCNLLK